MQFELFVESIQKIPMNVRDKKRNMTVQLRDDGYVIHKKAYDEW